MWHVSEKIFTAGSSSQKDFMTDVTIIVSVFFSKTQLCFSVFWPNKKIKMRKKEDSFFLSSQRTSTSSLIFKYCMLFDCWWRYRVSPGFQLGKREGEARVRIGEHKKKANTAADYEHVLPFFGWFVASWSSL